MQRGDVLCEVKDYRKQKEEIGLHAMQQFHLEVKVCIQFHQLIRY